MTKIRIFQPKEVMREYRKWMKANHRFDIVYASIWNLLSAWGIAMWYLGDDSEFIKFIAVFPLLMVLILQMIRHYQYNKQASEGLRRI